MGFWQFPASAKWDELDELRHVRLIHGALGDLDTGIERFDRKSFILYGPEEGLLFRPKTALFRICMCLYEALYAILP